MNTIKWLGKKVPLHLQRSRGQCTVLQEILDGKNRIEFVPFWLIVVANKRLDISAISVIIQVKAR
jgi:hypothetical protein